MTLPRRPLLVLALSSLLAWHALAGCSSESLPVAPVVDAEAPVDAVASKDASSSKDGGASPEAGELEGWVAWNDYDPKCRFQVPSDRKYLPEPFEWEPCQDTEVTRKMACRRIKKKWAGYRGEFIAPDTIMFPRDSGKLMIATLQYRGDNAIYLFSELDGPMAVAVHGSLTGECLITSHSGSGSRYIFQVAERDATGRWPSGPSGIGGSLDDLVPRKVLREPYEIAHALTAGNLGFADLSGGKIDIHSWSEPPTLLRSLTGGGAYSELFMHEDLFWFASDAPAPTERIWTPERGNQLFAGDASDRTRGTADLGTDGKDWVWGEGEGKTTSASYTTVKIVTAPFTREPSKLQRRVVRNDLGNGAFTAIPFAVGFGYAGHLSSRPDGQEGAMVVRLADGAAWFIPGRGASAVDFQHVLAISKDEAFLRVRDENGTNVYRVRLDSLGAFALPAGPN